MHWHKHTNNRTMPWKGEKDPYKIWLSEIILQQTRVEQGWAYYEKFLQHFPTIFHLAEAQDNLVFKLWEGLGYYNRCKNLLITARKIVNNFNGQFPDNYDELLACKGIGPYTAAAFASFAFNLPYAVVDGNVFRVLSRYTANNTAIDSPEGRQLFSFIAAEVLDKNEPGLYNQAIMDFGATVCKPFNPSCSSCVLNEHCLAFRQLTVNKLPVKEKSIHRKKRYFNYFILEHNNQWLIEQRTDNDIWQNLHEFYLVETEKALHWNQDLVTDYCFNWLPHTKYSIKNIYTGYKQVLTHQDIFACFIHINVQHVPNILAAHQWHNKETISEFAFPKIINQFLSGTVL